MLHRFPAFLILPLALTFLACSAYHKEPGRGAPKRCYGVYRGTFEDAEGRSRRFGVLLFAELPDRLHAEVLPPVGGALLILDAGGGLVSITLTREKTAWVGPAGSEVLEKVLGIRIGLEELVRSILKDEPSRGAVHVSRTPPGRKGLPERLELRSEGRRLQLRLRKRRKLAPSSNGLGTGAPPDGVQVRPLEELGGDEGHSLFFGKEVEPL